MSPMLLTRRQVAVSLLQHLPERFASQLPLAQGVAEPGAATVVGAARFLPQSVSFFLPLLLLAYYCFPTAPSKPDKRASGEPEKFAQFVQQIFPSPWQRHPVSRALARFNIPQTHASWEHVVSMNVYQLAICKELIKKTSLNKGL
jgi:hypothetical protein